MDRRRFLAIGASAATLSAAGCAGESNGDETDAPTEEPDATEQPSGDETEGESEEATEEPTPEPVEDGESYSFGGTGNEATDAFEVAGGLVTLAFEHAGSSNFQVQALGAGGQEEYLVNEIGTYDGELALAMAPGEWRLDITADGEWNAEIEQPRFDDSDIVDQPAVGTGEHAAWYGPFEFEGTTPVSFEIFDDSQAGVWLRTTGGEDVDLLHNEIGPYSGDALINQDGYGIIVVETDSAEWEIQIGE